MKVLVRGVLYDRFATFGGEPRGQDETPFVYSFAGTAQGVDVSPRLRSAASE